MNRRNSEKTSVSSIPRSQISKQPNLSNAQTGGQLSREPAKVNAGDTEFRVKELEQRLRAKFEVATGFADAEVRARLLERNFRFFDTDKSGEISYQEFFAAMTKLNFIGCQKDLECLFNKYDEDCSGTISYKEFGYGVFGIGDKPSMDVDSKNIVEKVKARIVQRGGASGFFGVSRILRRMDTDGSSSLDKEELREGLKAYGIGNIPDADMDKLFKYFDRDNSGKITIEEFLKGLSAGMSYQRKILVREVFDRLDSSGDGFVTVEDILGNFNGDAHPAVTQGMMTPAQAAREMLAVFEQGGDIDGSVTWPEFLDYYKGLSVGIDNDEYFELMIRNAWHISGGEGAAANSSNRRVLVIHSDGTQEVVEIKDDFGMNNKFERSAIIRKLEKQGVRDIADVKKN